MLPGSVRRRRLQRVTWQAAEMKRQILVSADPVRATTPDGSESGAPELGRWLTHELRAKGAPSRPPRATESSRSGQIELAERQSEQVVLARWLTSDLRLRPSTPPADGIPPATPPSLDPASGALSTDALASPLIAPEQALSLAHAELDADDLSVLPPRHRARVRSHGRAFLLVALLLSVLGLFAFRRGTDGGAVGTEVAGQAQADVGTLLPPAPSDALVPLEPEPTVPPAAPGARRPTSVAEAESAPDPNDPRGRLGGPSVARFPDLPPPTLSRLADDELEQARERAALTRSAVQGPASELAAQ
jgi:hypothetical protein